MKIINVTKSYETYDWFYILPSIEIRHKYWYLWEINLSWLKWNRRYEIHKIEIK